MYNGENGKKLGSSVEHIIKTQEMRARAWENAGQTIDNTGNGIKAMETWKAKMQDMSWEAEGMKAKCRNPGN